MKIRFWGTRGSLAKPGPSTVRFGGNTSCVEVRTAAGTLLILDCGTGAHDLSQHLLRTVESPVSGNLLISHTHWDHIQGIPFFAPFFVPGNEWDIYAPQGFGDTLRTTLAGQMEYTFFPITPDAFGATINYHNVNEGTFDIGDARITTRFLNHPALTIGYRIEADGGTVVYACDHEPHARDAALGTAELKGQDEAHVDFLKDADLVIHDAQYTAAEYPSKAGWGHSTVEYAVRACEMAGVRQLALTHHDPTRDDDSVDRLLSDARSSQASGRKLEIIGAAEGLILNVEGSRRSSKNLNAPAAGPPANTVTSQSVMVITSEKKLFDQIGAAVSDEGLIAVQAVSATDGAHFMADGLPALVVIDGRLKHNEISAIASSTARVPKLVIGAPNPANEDRQVEYIPVPFSREYLRSRIKTWLMRSKFASIPPSMPEVEAKRVAALRSIQLLDTPAEERFDRFTRIAASLFNVPISLITLVDDDRQWFKSKVGLKVPETSRQTSFCAHAIYEPLPFIIPDALQDERFQTNPLVLGPPRIRFYAGVALHVEDAPIGTLCLIDTKPRVPTKEEVRMLQDMGALVQHEIQLGRQR